MRNIDWNAVQARWEDASKVQPPRQLEQKQFAELPSITAEEVKAMLDSGAAVQIIDTRPKHYSTRAQDMMAGAIWRDPERVDDWIGESRKRRPSSRSASMASIADAKRRQRFGKPASMPDTWPGATMPGKRSRGRSSFSHSRALWTSARPLPHPLAACRRRIRCTAGLWGVLYGNCRGGRRHYHSLCPIGLLTQPPDS
jgi:hypothetical protein